MNDEQTPPGGLPPENQPDTENEPSADTEPTLVQEPPLVEPEAPAAAAQVDSEEARRRARRNTIAVGVGLFAVVFALIGFQMAGDNDNGDRAGFRQGPQGFQPRGQQGGYGQSDDSWGGQQGGPPQGAPPQGMQGQGPPDMQDQDMQDQDQQGQGQQGQGQQGPPTSRAS
jgi:hypothetical protein